MTKTTNRGDKLQDFKRGFARSHDWRLQRGANDTANAARDRETIREVWAARTWDEILEVIPGGRWERRAVEEAEVEAELNALGDYKGRIGVDSEGTTFVVLSADDSEVVIIGSGQVLHASHLSFPLHFDGEVLHQRDCWP
jgi:hypothetical protein